MRLFPNPVFEPSSFDRLYFFNTLVRGYSREFYLDLLVTIFDETTSIWVEEPIEDGILINNIPHPDIGNKFKGLDEFRPWIKHATMHSTQCTVGNSSNSIQIYSDPHDWDVCVIGCKENDNHLVKDWLVESGNYERRMTSIDEFHAIWHEIAVPKMFDYAVQNLKESYMPFIQ